MFSHLRYVALLCLLIVLIGGAGLSFYFSSTKNEFLLQTETEAAKAAMGSYNSSIWQRYAAELTTNPQAAVNLQAETQAFFAHQPYLKVTIFSADMQRLYFNSTSVNAEDGNNARITLFDLPQAQAGKTVSRLQPDSYFRDGANASTPRLLAQLIVPISRTGTTTPEALAELYIDVETPSHALQRLQYLLIGTMAGASLLMVGLLLFMAGRAEAIINKQHEVNLELTAAASQAEAQSQDKSQFLASVSHELRTPLNAIIGFSEILRNEVRVTLDKTYQEHIDDIYASGKHLLSLINDILDFSKAEAGKLQVEWAETDATKIIRNSLRMVLPRAETAQVTLIESIPSHHLVIVTDPKKLKQVLLNLLSNAVKFTPAGGEVRCQAWVDVATKNLIITVNDTGIGIAPKDISKVMTPFGQVESALSRRYEGTGLGLPLSKKFVESMGGEFAIQSELNVGTTITLTIPHAPPGWRGEAHPYTTQEESDVQASTNTAA